jgi:hypothetical protein
MYLSPHTIMDLAKLHSDELIQKADRQRLADRVWRRRRATDSRNSGRRAEQRTVSRLEPGRAARTVQVGRT